MGGMGGTPHNIIAYGYYYQLHRLQAYIRTQNFTPTILPTRMENVQAVLYRGLLYVRGGHTTDNDSALFTYQFKPDT